MMTTAADPVDLAGLLARWGVGPGVNGLSLLQPWASLMALGEKAIETRSWATRYRGAVAIAASARWQAENIEIAVHDPDFVAAWRRHPDYFATGAMKDLPLGAIVAVGRLVDCLRADGVGPTLRAQSRAGLMTIVAGVKCGIAEAEFGAYGEGRFGFVVADLHRLIVPVPCKGRQGFWAVTGETRAALDASGLVAA
jgi:hypothetical protein